VCSSRFATPGELDKVAEISNPKLAQTRALVSVLKLVAPALTNEELAQYSKCTPTPEVRPVELWQNGFVVRWYINCILNPYAVTTLSFKVDVAATPDSTLQGSLPTLNETLLFPILALRDGLQQLEVQVYGGELPVQLGSLLNLDRLSVFHYCMTGGLPPNLLLGTPKLGLLWISEAAGAERYQPDGAQCGITGPVPPEWYTPTPDATGTMVTPGASLQTIALSENKLSGSLPDILGWPALQLLFLDNNDFSGGVSGSVAVASAWQAPSS
jgi:hypothetical protein